MMIKEGNMMIKDGKMTPPESIQVCVLYDPQNGQIVHTHQVVTYPGGRRLSAQEVESRTLQLGGKMGLQTSKLKTLLVPHEQYTSFKPFKVDVKSKRLIELPLPKGLGLASRLKKARRKKTARSPNL